MDKIHRYLMVGTVISILLLYFAVWGLWQTNNLLYLLALTCCLSTLVFIIYHLIKLTVQETDPQTEIRVIIVRMPEPESFSDPLFVKVKKRM